MYGGSSSKKDKRKEGTRNLLHGLKKFHFIYTIYPLILALALWEMCANPEWNEYCRKSKRVWVVEIKIKFNRCLFLRHVPKIFHAIKKGGSRSFSSIFIAPFHTRNCLAEIEIAASIMWVCVCEVGMNNREKQSLLLLWRLLFYDKEVYEWAYESHCNRKLHSTRSIFLALSFLHACTPHTHRIFPPSSCSRVPSITHVTSSVSFQTYCLVQYNVL
jgi:hypothetical protein